MYQTTVKCKSLRLVESEAGNQAVSVASHQENAIPYVEAGLETHQEKFHLYLSLPSELLDVDLKIGDEILVTFERKNK